MSYSTSASPPVNVVKLKEFILRAFNLSEMQSLFFDMEGKSYEGAISRFANAIEFAEEMIGYFGRVGKLDALVGRCKADRPGANIDWNEVYGDATAGLRPADIASIAVILTRPDILPYTRRSSARFKEFDASLKRLRDYKELHDQCHGLVYNHLVRIGKPPNAQDVAQLVRELGIEVRKMRSTTNQPTFSRNEKEGFLSQIERTRQDLDSAAKSANKAQIKKMLTVLANGLNGEMTRVNQSLMDEAKRLHDHTSFRDAIVELRDIVAGKPDTAAVIASLDTGISGVEGARNKLFDLIKVHDDLQRLHDELAFIRPHPEEHLQPNDPNWRELVNLQKPLLTIVLSDADLDVLLSDHKQSAASLAQAVEKGNRSEAMEAYKSYNDAAEELFYIVDVKLTRYLNELADRFLPLLGDVLEKAYVPAG